MGNQALTINPTGVGSTFNLTTNGSNWLWSVFSLMALTAIIIALLSMRQHPRDRTFHLLSISTLATASIAYFCMASNLGFAPIEVFQRGPGGRQFWYVRYIDWFITTPLLLTELLLTAGLPMNIILSTIFADLVMVVCGLIGGLVPSIYKWAFFVFGCVAMLWVFWNILTGIKSSEKIGGKQHRRVYLILAAWLLFFWCIYPIAWGLCEGSNVISVTGEMIFYGILDIFTKPIFALLFLFLHRNVDSKKKGSNKDEVRVERLAYQPPPPQQNHRQNIEYVDTSDYVMGSPNIIRGHY